MARRLTCFRATADWGRTGADWGELGQKSALATVPRLVPLKGLPSEAVTGAPSALSRDWGRVLQNRVGRGMSRPIGASEIVNGQRLVKAPHTAQTGKPWVMPAHSTVLALHGAPRGNLAAIRGQSLASRAVTRSAPRHLRVGRLVRVFDMSAMTRPSARPFGFAIGLGAHGRRRADRGFGSTTPPVALGAKCFFEHGLAVKPCSDTQKNCAGAVSCHVQIFGLDFRRGNHVKVAIDAHKFTSKNFVVSHRNFPLLSWWALKCAPLANVAREIRKSLSTRGFVSPSISSAISRINPLSLLSAKRETANQWGSGCFDMSSEPVGILGRASDDFDNRTAIIGAVVAASDPASFARFDVADCFVGHGLSPVDAPLCTPNGVWSIGNSHSAHIFSSGQSLARGGHDKR